MGSILNQGNSLSEYEVSMKVTFLLRHSQVHREEDGAVHFWRMREKNLRNPLPQSIHWSDDRWKARSAAGRSKRRFQYCTDGSGAIVDFRAVQGHSGRHLIDPSLQENVVISSNFFLLNLPYWMCVQSEFHQLWISTWRSKFEKETDLLACSSYGKESQGS